MKPDGIPWHDLLNINTMEPSEALSTGAQIAVALAGFAGVVVVFRRESVHDSSAIDKFRLPLLLTNSILPLALCVIGLLLLTVKLAPARNLALVQRRRGRNSFAVCDYNIQNLSQTGSAAVQSAPATGVAFYLFGLLRVGALLL
jgi:drug/metabolite transporter (DMT)-like permease